MKEDLQYLRWLSIAHTIVAGIVALFGCFPIIHLVIGILMLGGHLQDAHGNGPPAIFGLLFVGIAATMIAMFWALAVALLVVARRLSEHRGHTFCLVVAAVECMFVPIGTVLGVLTIIVLMRPSVRTLFGVDTGTLAGS